MAVTAYDGSFSFKQDSLARLGDRAHRGGMSPQDMANFQNSPFMQSMRKIDELTFQKMSIRDKKRQSTDPTFKPRDEDFEAAKSHKYDKCMNYYKTLGIDEYDPQKQVKDAYKRLSLVYHPDKTAGLPSEVKDEYALIFIELKSAYQTLTDNPTRRQYDRDRDKDQAAAELNGWKVKERAQFDATEVLKKLQEHKDSKKPSKTVELNTRCRLEKFFYGGHKAIKRKRNAKNKMGYFEEERIYRIDVPAGHCEPFVADFRRQGDCHDDQHPDTLRFKVTSKPHERVERKDKDLHVKSQVPLGEAVESQPYITAQVETVRGRQLLLWGVNPFFRNAESAGAAQLHVRVRGEGLGEDGALVFAARAGAVPAAAPAPAEAAAPGAEKSTEPQGDGRVLLKVKHLMTEAELYLKASPMDTIGDIRKQCLSLLSLGRGSMLKLLKPLGAGKFTPHADSAMLRDLMTQPLPPGEVRSFVCGGTEWHGPSLNTEKSVAFLKKVLEVSERPQQRNLLELAKDVVDPQERADYWRRGFVAYTDVLTDFGYRPEESVFKENLVQALMGAGRTPEGGQLRLKFEALKAEWTAAQQARKPGKPDGKAKAGEPARPTWAPGVSSAKRFLEQFKLAPEGGFKEREVPPALRRRALRRASRDPVCEVLLQPMGGPVTLHTKPGCQLCFYSNFEGCSPASSSRAEPCTLFAVCLASQACSKGKLANDWDRLKYKVLPLLQASCFRLLRVSRGLLPKPLPARPAFGSWGQRRVDPDDGSEYTWDEFRKWYSSKFTEAEIVNYWDTVCKPLPAPPTPWKRLGDEAFRRGDCWLAINFYSQQLEDLPQADANEASARVLCNRAGCFAKVKEYGMSLQDGRMAAKLWSSWARPWSRVGYAASMCGSDEDLAEARAAYYRAVVLEPSETNVKALHAAVEKAVQPEAEASHKAKEMGNEAMRVKEWSTAVAAYTEGLAELPPEAFSDTEEVLPFLRCVLLCNRSGAFARLRNWNAAVADAQEAVEVKKGFAKAHCRLAVALLGNRYYERAYNHFAKSLILQEDYPAARKGRNECLREVLRWSSVPAAARLARRLKDAVRPKGTTRVFAICDVHFDHKVNEDWAHAIDDGMFQDDVLIVAGDLAGTKGAVVRGLTTLRAKFRRVFYTVGHHEMWIHYGEHERYPDSIAKLHGIFETCDELGVDVVADAVCEDVFIVPLHSWYNAEFDEKDPWPDPGDRMDSQTRWPMDPDDQVWKYMLKLNEGAMGLPFHGTVISFSHFLPRRNLPLPQWPGMKTSKSSGCERIDDLVRGVRSKLHVFGHSHERYFASHAGVTYVNQPLGFSNEQHGVDLMPMLLVYDGRTTCARPWDITQNRPQ